MVFRAAASVLECGKSADKILIAQNKKPGVRKATGLSSF